MRWRDHDSVSESSLSPAVVGENRVRYHGRRSVFVPFGNQHFDAVGCQHLKRTRQTPAWKAREYPSQETVDHLCAAVFDKDKLPA